MVWIIVPRRVVRHYCPYCRKRERFFFSLLPILKPEWRCRSCRRKFKITAGCIGSNWAGVFGLYTMPLTFLLGELFLVFAAFHKNATAPGPNALQTLMGAVCCGGPIVMLFGVLPFMILGYFAGLIYGMFAVNR